ncbi:hypothetical protein cypCar_00008136 [Cyprinus carpio]|nr:hypothetical protein cypCar_00008136 [Cyprinus carpio]
MQDPSATTSRGAGTLEDGFRVAPAKKSPKLQQLERKDSQGSSHHSVSSQRSITTDSPTATASQALLKRSRPPTPSQSPVQPPMSSP